MRTAKSLRHWISDIATIMCATGFSIAAIALPFPTPIGKAVVLVGSWLFIIGTAAFCLLEA